MNDITTFLEAEKDRVDEEFPPEYFAALPVGYFSARNGYEPPKKIKEFLSRHDKRLLAKVREIVGKYIDENRQKIERIDRYILDDLLAFIKTLEK